MRKISVDNITRILKEAGHPAGKEVIDDIMSFLCRQQEEGFFLTGTIPVNNTEILGLFESGTGRIKMLEL